MSFDLYSQPVAGAIQGEITVPGDKSISHRAIVLGAIAQGQTLLHGYLKGADCLATRHAFQAMGVKIEDVQENSLLIHGVGKRGLTKPIISLDCANSGTTMRLLAGLLAAQEFDSSLSGDASLLQRPMDRISRPLHQMGAEIMTTNGHAPLIIHGSPQLRGITYEMTEASAQVKSCLLLAGLYAAGETRVIETHVTRDHTELMLAAFSYPVSKSGNIIIINASSECHGTEIWVPGDLSAAAFFMVAATLIPDSDLLIKNVGINPTRVGVIQILKKMGANIEIVDKRLLGEEIVGDIRVQHAVLEGTHIPATLVPVAIDEFPIIFIAAACAKGQTILHGAKELRYKESDRLQAMTLGLQRLGIEVQALDDGILINGGVIQGGAVHSFHDHRVIMSFAIAGAVATNPVQVVACDKLNVSFPNFVELANQVNCLLKEASA